METDSEFTPPALVSEEDRALLAVLAKEFPTLSPQDLEYVYDSLVCSYILINILIGVAIAATFDEKKLTLKREE